MMRTLRTPRKTARVLGGALVMGTLGLLLLTACNTSSGFGKDVQSVGRNIERSANKNNR